MRVIEHMIQFPETEIRCSKCQSLSAYTSADILVYWSPWQRTGVDSSKRNGHTYVRCPVCAHQIILKDLTEEY